MNILVAVCLVIVGVVAEPPAHQYLPPQQEYSDYSNPSGSYEPPTQPEQLNYDTPSQNYGAPQNSYEAPKSVPSYELPKPQYGAPANGFAKDNYESSEPANYQFDYMVKDQESGNDFGHKESRQGDLAQGSYYVVLPDGRKQTVEYEADQNGYRPKISYEEGYAKTAASNGGYNYAPKQAASSNTGYSY